MNLPILSAGKQAQGSGRVCAEQAVNWLVSGRQSLGAESDHPECVQPVLNALAIAVNDRVSDKGRQRMWPLILAQPGTARPDLEPELTLYLATWLAIYVAPLGAYDAAAYAADASAAYYSADAAAYAADAARAAAYAAYAAADAARAAAYDAADATDAAYAADAYYNDAAAYAADAAADATDAAYYGDPAAYAADDALIALLTDAQAELRDLIGYDDVCEITDDRVERLGVLVGTR